MRIAIGLPSRVASATGAAMLEWITRAERGPFSSVVVTDRVVSQALEPLSVLAMAAGATQRIRLMTSVVIGPTRETTLLARQAATVDVLSGGRLTLGLGIGVRENDYLATGCDFHRRGRRAEEQLPILRRLWSGGNLSGEVGAIGPRSGNTNGPELLIGGYVPAIVQRIAKWGDGYMAPGGGEPESRKACSRCGARSNRHGKRRGERESRVGSERVIMRSVPTPQITRAAISTRTTDTIPIFRRGASARCRLRARRWKRRSSARAIWALMNSFSGPAPTISTKWTGSRK
ncbi:MAG: LLM class flavin-dependent oxidoreductase [Deltaproteobacteria bacterium]|nr:LLM class flavin-dependent oxidoreductase [Deltaproteobacteria bacterium]